MTDPQFPKRPDHPHLWMIAQAVQDVDRVSQTAPGTDAFEEMANRYVDLKSAAYTAMNRVKRLLDDQHATVGNDVFKMMVSIWMDGMVAGIGFQKLLDTDAQTVHDKDIPRAEPDGTAQDTP